MPRRTENQLLRGTRGLDEQPTHVEEAVLHEHHWTQLWRVSEVVFGTRTEIASVGALLWLLRLRGSSWGQR